MQGKKNKNSIEIILILIYNNNVTQMFNSEY